MYEAIPDNERVLFALYPFRLLAKSEIEYPCRRSSTPQKCSYVVVSSRDNRGRVKRFNASQSELADLVSEFAELTDDPVLVGKFEGLTRINEPVFRSVARAATDMAKAATNPLSDEALTRWVNDASRKLGILARRESVAMVDEMLEWIDFEWSTASGQQWDAMQAGLRGVFGNPSAKMIMAQRVETARILQRVLQRTGAGTARLPGVAGQLAAGFRVPDRRISQAMMRHHGFFVRDRYGQMAPRLAGQVQQIIQGGIERGLGRRELERVLARQVSGGLQMPGYWQTVAANAVSRSRSYAMGSTFQAAGITHYRIEAIIDETTTETCMMLHEQILPVAGSMANLNRVISPQSTPQDTMRYHSFIRREGNEFRADHGDGTSTVVATREEGGGYNRLAADRMAGAGVGFPPYHHRCRTTVVPEV